MPRILDGPLRRVLVVEEPDPLLDRLLGEAGVQVTRLPDIPEEDELLDLLRARRIQAIFKRSRMPLTRRVVAGAPDLMVVQLCSIGVDSVDLGACAEHGVLVFNDPVSNGRSVAELVVGHLVALSRRIYETCEETAAGCWRKDNRGRFEVQGKVLGVLGMGRIGRQVARLAACMGMDVLFYDDRLVAREVGEEMGWRLAPDPVALFRGADAVTVHVSATNREGRSNRGLVSRELLLQLAADRPQPSPRLFLNLSRGIVVEPDDLLAAVRDGAVRRAAVDVFPEEPRGATRDWPNPFRGEPRIVATPHIGAATLEAQPRIARRVARTFLDFSLAGSVRDCAFDPRLSVAMTDDAAGAAVLVAVHGTARGTRRALDQAIYELGADNLRSQHRDLPRLGVAIDLNLLDRALDPDELARLARRTEEIAGERGVLRSLRQVRRASPQEVP